MYGDMVDSMEIMKKKKENSDIVNNVMKKIQGWEVLDGPGLQHFGELVMEGNLKLLENGRNNARLFFLLQKLLVILREDKSFTKKDTQYKVIEKIQISRNNLLAVNEFEDGLFNDQFSLYLFIQVLELELSFTLCVKSEDSVIRNLMVTAYNPEQRNSWILNISKELEKNTKTPFPSLPIDIQNEIRRLSGPEAILSPKSSGLQRTNSSGEHLKSKTKKFFKGLGAILRRPSILGFKEINPEQNLEPPAGEVLPIMSNNSKPASEASNDGFSIKRRKEKDITPDLTVFRSDPVNENSNFKTKSSTNSDSRTNSHMSSQSQQESDGLFRTSSTLSITSVLSTNTSPFSINPLNVESVKKKTSRNVLSTLSQGLGGYFSNSETPNSDIIRPYSTAQSPNSEPPVIKKISKSRDPQTSQISVIDLETHLPTSIVNCVVESKIQLSKEEVPKSEKLNSMPLLDKLDEIFSRNGVSIMNETTSRKTVEISVPEKIEVGSIVQTISQMKYENDKEKQIDLNERAGNITNVEGILLHYDSSSSEIIQSNSGRIMSTVTNTTTSEIQEEIINVKWNPQQTKDEKKTQPFLKLSRNASSTRPRSDLFDLVGSKLSLAFRPIERDGSSENTAGLKPTRKPSKLVLNSKDQSKTNLSETSSVIPKEEHSVLTNSELEQHPVVIGLLDQYEEMKRELNTLKDRLDNMEKYSGRKNIALEE
ncbi:hypothetical protein HK096_006321 [Nowakowskiella sp. JEL0078]|nr:hypothetical protein HK096_006321 [Nowakowskiella sp. JEL0078]